MKLAGLLTFLSGMKFAGLVMSYPRHGVRVKVARVYPACLPIIEELDMDTTARRCAVLPSWQVLGTLRR